MIILIHTALMCLIACVLGTIGAYFTNWEQNIYLEYLTYLLPPIFISSMVFVFIDKKISLVLALIFVMGLSWYSSTKLWFNKK